MTWIAPMLASPMRADFQPKPGECHAEEKFDGLRLCVEVSHEVPEDLLTDYTVRTWSRDGIPHAVPRHLREALGKLPSGIYDGELYVPGRRSYGATRIDLMDKYQVVIFDVLNLAGQDVTAITLRHRRDLLTMMFAHEHVKALAPFVTLAEARVINSFADVESFRDEVWARDGEGLIIKDLGSLYRPGKRDKSWIKIKQLRTAALTVVGFTASFGKIQDRGPCALVVLRDEQGTLTSVKTRNNMWCHQLEREMDGHAPSFEKMKVGARSLNVNTNHPRVGQVLRIEYQEHTPDESYRHGRWDRWENE